MLGTIAKAGKLLSRNPSYILGRFQTTRKVYSLLQRMVRRGSNTIQIGPMHAKSGVSIPLGKSGHIVSSHSTEKHVNRINLHAWSDGISLAPETVDALCDFASNSWLRYTAEANIPLTITRLDELPVAERNSVTCAHATTAHNNEIIRAIASDQLLVDVIERYLGFTPKLVEPYLFWSFNSGLSFEERVKRMQTVEYHFDVHSLSFTYVSFYLKDTDRHNGAHALIKGTHNKKPVGLMFGSARISDEVAEATFGADNIVVVEKAAGAGFFEDTSCYHKALPPVTNDRLMLQLRYT